MFRKVFVANRGAVAARVIRALREMDIRSALGYSEADAQLPYVAQADEAVLLGPASPAESYLHIERLIAAALSVQADAIHPGYGFLSENAEFARKVREAGMVFIGPSPQWLQAMGHKTRARETMAQHGMPMCPSSGLLTGSLAEQIEAAQAAGFPMLIKPAAGGGGIGMIPVDNAAALPEALAKARGLAERSFANGELYTERLFMRPRHIEFQIMADNFGAVQHLFERDCSLQRRHQKVIEEAGAPRVARATLDDMAGQATDILRTIGYDNIGTIETLYDPQAGFSFLEMNTRLQVEHGVTEEVTGVDIVKSQIRLAAGARLADVLSARPTEPQGHAIQARIYAEDPWRFLPSPGVLKSFNLPSSPGIRIETGFGEGNRVSSNYDPMIAKVIAHASDRTGAIGLLKDALSACNIEGVKTNIPFLIAALSDDEFRSGEVHTHLAADIVKRHAPVKPSAPLAA
nr:biotin carboxylase [Pseudomonas sp.]